MKTLLVFILALTAWLHPIKAVSASNQNQDEAIFINYEKFHKPPVPQKGNGDRKISVKKVPESAYNGRNYTKEEVIQLIKNYSQEFKISVETPLCIAKLESGYNQFSKNKSSSASGVFQYLNATWKGTDEGRAGRSVFDAEANVLAAIKYMSIHKSTKPWITAPKCPALKSL